MSKEIFKEGFTLVELSLSIAFIGVLSISIVLIISNTVASYRRGLTLSQVNTIGTDIVEDIRTTIHNATVKIPENLCLSVYNESSTLMTECENDQAYNFVSVTKYADIKINNEYDSVSMPMYGAFCTGSYSYIWNSGYFKTDNTEIPEDVKPATLIYLDINGVKHDMRDGSDDEGEEMPFKLLKVRDDDRDVCVSAITSTSAKDKKYKIPSSGIGEGFDITSYGLVSEEPEELIGTGDSNDLVIYDFSVARLAESKTNNNLFYSISFILGTVQGGADIKAKGRSCATPSDYSIENFDYCAINKFNFAVQANGE